MMTKSDSWTVGRTSTRRMAMLASICVIALTTAVALPVTLGDEGITVKAAYAGNGNGGNNGNNGNGNGNGKGTAPGQEKQLADGQPASDDAVTAVTDGAGEIGQQPILPIAEDAEPATNKVIKELAGLPEESELSEEEELEAIRSGWGTWRTADGPETVIAQ